MVVTAFDACGDLPRGVTVLEASAGTGKTWTIAALAARYVAEGTPLERLLLVTFTRMATGELRERVRERLVGVHAGLGHADPVDDKIVDLLRQGDVAQRRANLARALAEFDAATIATTHSFCQEMLSSLGVAADVDTGGDVVEEVPELLSEVVDDLYLRKFRDSARPEITHAEAAEIARLAVANVDAPLADASTDTGRMRRSLADAVRHELDRRKRALGVMTYDDLLTRLDTAMDEPEAVARVRARFDVVLVDEFQDTDPVQWNILRRAFASAALVLIGDPKQAIYAFRGADVYAYLDAARGVPRHPLLVNWRSDQELLDAYDALFDGARLGHAGIVCHTVRAAPDHERRLRGTPDPAPLRARVVPRAAIVQTPAGYAQKASAKAHIAEDLAADMVALLRAGARIGDAVVEPGHLAVLVRINRDAALVREALDRAGIPAVIRGAGSVFETPEALAWLRLLQAIERPASTPRAHVAALTPFLGWTPAQVAAAGDDAWEDVHSRLHQWGAVLRTRGVASLTEAITLGEGLPGRVLRFTDGERRLTDLRHVGQLLHGAATTEQLGVAALTAWLRRRIAEAGRDGDEDRSRRLESDAAAVQVLTIHRSKGLEFPIVYCPYLWDSPWVPREPKPVVFHAPHRTLDVALEGSAYQQHRQQALQEERGEELRLAYVALTRARHQAVVWWAGTFDSRHSALGRLLFARGPDGAIAAAGTSTPSDEAVKQRLELLRGTSVADAVQDAGARWQGTPEAPRALAAAVFHRALDRQWRRTSYSDITAGAHEARVGSEPEEPLLADEPDAAAAPGAATTHPLAAMPVGVRFGTLVHHVLEAADFAAADIDVELAARVAQARAHRPLDLPDTAALVAGLRGALQTPIVGGTRLRDLTAADRLDELTFELPLAGGDVPTGQLTLAAIAATLRAHLPADDPLAGYAGRLADGDLRHSVRGYLTGSIDLVLRTGGRYAVVDYKTNQLEDYGPPALAAEMERYHYALQALLYTVALHRYLGWRLPGYDPAQHLAGVRYLFLRGMPAGGVFAWHPPPALVTALSDVLDGAAS